MTFLNLPGHIKIMSIPTVQPIKPTTLAELIAKVESNNDQFAVRFEPLFHPKLENISKLAVQSRVSYHTAEILCAMSFGLYQIMCDDWMNMGLTVSPVEYCSNPAMQDAFFKQYCIENHCDYSLEDIVNDQSKREDFAKKYNGPGNIDAYATRLLSFM